MRRLDHGDFHITNKILKVLCSKDLQLVRDLGSFDIRSHSLRFVDVLCSYFWPHIGHLRKWTKMSVCH